MRKKVLLLTAIAFVMSTAVAVNFNLNDDKMVDNADHNKLSPKIVNQSTGYDACYGLNNDGNINAVNGNLLVEIIDTLTYTVNGVSFKMVKVEGGTFTMGATVEQDSDARNNEKPAHLVTVSNFSIGQTEVTQELWQAVMGSNPSYFTGDLQRPVERISWDDCQTFIAKLNILTGRNFRLPTEAEWEFAARGGSNSQGFKFGGSDIIDQVAWFRDNSFALGSGNPEYGTHTVTTKAPNELGLYDMSGNVWEWCQDWFDNSYFSNSPDIDPNGPATGTNRVHRGGSWRDNASSCRVSARSSNTPSFNGNNLGLRLACNPVISTELHIQPEEMTMIVGYKSELNAITIPDDAFIQDFEWTSNNTDIVEIDSNGVIRAKSPGVATVTATTKDGANISSTSTVTVIPSTSENKNDFTINGVSFNMIPIEGGAFTMGATSEQVGDARENEFPTHQVLLSDYKIGETEVTQALWQAVMGYNPSYFTNDQNLPVEQVTWDECQIFVSKLRRLTGVNFRLPTEAEWEYAARGGNKSQGLVFAGSNSINDVAWYKDNCNSTTHIVATKMPNELGLYDMSGNVYEWCQDRFGNYTSETQSNPTGISSGLYRAHRGGGWYDHPKFCRVSVRYHADTSHKIFVLGLRLACDLPRATSISIQPSDLSLYIGQDTILSVVISPNDVSLQRIDWASSDPTIAEVDSNGKVTAKSPGEAKIIATTTDGSESSDTCTVTVRENKATSILVTPDTVMLDIGGNIRLQTTITPEEMANQLLQWQSSNDDVAIVSSKGLVYGVGAGQALIIATTTDGSELSDTCHVIVRVPFELSAQTVAAPVNTLRNIPIAIDNHVEVKSFAMTVQVPDSIQYYGDAIPGPRCSDFNVTTTYNADSTVMRIEGVMTAQPMSAGTGTFVMLPIKSSKYIANFDILVTDITFTSTNDGVGTQELDDINVTLHVLDLGDVNGDKVVDVSDVNTLINYMLGKQSDLTNFGVGDINNDGIIDVSDVNAVINIMLGKG